MAEEYKKQHIVPQAYLNRFASKGTGKTYVIGTRCKSRPSSEIVFYKQSVSNVGYLDNYYDTDKKTPKYWEHFLGDNFDTLCGRPLGNIIAGITLAPDRCKVLSDETKDTLSRIMLSQMFRVPAVLNERVSNAGILFKDMKREFLDTNKNLPQNFLTPIKQLSISENDCKDMVLDAMFDEERVEKFCNVLNERLWLAYYNANYKSFPFCTSDNPVILCNNLSGELGFSNNGIGRIDTSIVFPLSPAIAIGPYPPSIGMGAIQEFDGQKLMYHDDKFTAKINRCVAEQSYKQTFLPEPLFSECERLNDDTEDN